MIRKALAAALVLFAVGCSLLHVAKPTAYGAELAACEQKSSSWRDYAPCCAEVAGRYGRDPAFCYPPGDAGFPDGE